MNRKEIHIGDGDHIKVEPPFHWGIVLIVIFALIVVGGVTWKVIDTVKGGPDGKKPQQVVIASPTSITITPETPSITTTFIPTPISVTPNPTPIPTPIPLPTLTPAPTPTLSPTSTTTPVPTPQIIKNGDFELDFDFWEIEVISKGRFQGYPKAYITTSGQYGKVAGFNVRGNSSLRLKQVVAFPSRGAWTLNISEAALGSVFSNIKVLIDFAFTDGSSEVIGQFENSMVGSYQKKYSLTHSIMGKTGELRIQVWSTESGPVEQEGMIQRIWVEGG